jgi:hypothetical protein
MWTEGTVSGRDEKQIRVTYYISDVMHQYWYHEDCDDIRFPYLEGPPLNSFCLFVFPWTFCDV